jgi:hypothetical protein
MEQFPVPEMDIKDYFSSVALLEIMSSSYFFNILPPH